MRKPPATFWRSGFLFLLIVMLFSTQSARAQEPASLEMQVQAGFDSRCKEGRWMPVRVILENNGPDLEGQVQLRMPEGAAGSVTYAAPVSLPSVSRKEVVLYIHPQGYLSSVQIVFMADNRIVEESRVPVTCANPTDTLVGLIAASPTPFQVIATLNPTSGNIFTAEMSLADLPEHPLGLDALDLMVISSVDTGILTGGQRSALEGWLAGGGRLLVTGGPDWQKTAAGLEAMMPVSLDETISIDQWDALEDFAGDQYPLSGEALLSVGDLSEGAEALVTQSGLPLIIQRSFGQGQILYLGLDPGLRPLLGWPGMGGLFQRLLSLPSEQPAWASGFRNWYSLKQAAGSLPALDLPSGFLVCGFLGFYVLLIGPLNFFALRKLKRGELAWISIPVMVIAFSGLAFLFGGLLRGELPMLNRLAIVQVEPDSPIARVYGAVGVFSPSRMTYELSIGPEYLAHPLPVEDQGQEWLILESAGGESRVPDLRLEVGGIRSIALEGTTAAPSLTTDLIIEPAPTSSQSNAMRLSGSVTNRSQLTLSDAVLLAPGKTEHLGELRPGETRQIDLLMEQAQYTGENQSMFMAPGSASFTVFPPYPSWYDSTIEDVVGTGANFDDREHYRRYELLSAAMNSDFGTMGRGAGVYLSGWVEQSPLDVAISYGGRERFDTLDTTLYFFNLSPQLRLDDDQIALHPAMFSWKSIGGTTYSSISPYNAYLNNGQTMTIEFQLAHPVPYRSVEELILHFASPAGSIPQSLQVELWDFQQSTYIEVDTLTQGDNDIPEPGRFVSPENQIRVLVGNVSGGSYSPFEIQRLDFTLVVEQ